MYIETTLYAGDNLGDVEIPFDILISHDVDITTNNTKVEYWGSQVNIQEVDVDDVEHFEYKLIDNNDQSDSQTLDTWVSNNWNQILYFLNHLTLEL